MVLRMFRLGGPEQGLGKRPRLRARRSRLRPRRRCCVLVPARCPSGRQFLGLPSSACRPCARACARVCHVLTVLGRCQAVSRNCVLKQAGQHAGNAKMPDNNGQKRSLQCFEFRRQQRLNLVFQEPDRSGRRQPLARDTQRLLKEITRFLGAERSIEAGPVGDTGAGNSPHRVEDCFTHRRAPGDRDARSPAPPTSAKFAWLLRQKRNFAKLSWPCSSRS